MNLVSRQQWGARPPKKVTPIPLPAPEIWIHHSVTDSGPDEVQIMKQIQNYHMDSKKWRDIGYSFVVFPTGTVYEGRGWGVSGAHTAGHNSSGHGICFVGNFQNEQPTTAALDAARELIHGGQSQGFVGSGVLPTGGHRDVSATACPGNNLYSKLDYLRQPYEPPQEGPPEVDVNHPPVRIMTHPSWGDGYTIVTSDGGVFNFGGSPFYGSLGGVALNSPVVDAYPTATGEGYFLLGEDGGVFAFGDAQYGGRVSYNG